MLSKLKNKIEQVELSMIKDRLMISQNLIELKEKMTGANILILYIFSGVFSGFLIDAFLLNKDIIKLKWLSLVVNFYPFYNTCKVLLKGLSNLRR